MNMYVIKTEDVLNFCADVLGGRYNVKQVAPQMFKFIRKSSNTFYELVLTEFLNSDDFLFKFQRESDTSRVKSNIVKWQFVHPRHFTGNVEYSDSMVIQKFVHGSHEHSMALLLKTKTLNFVRHATGR